MDCREIIDNAISIIARDDVDRTALLHHCNVTYRTFMRSRSLSKLQTAKQFSVTAQAVVCTNLKTPTVVRWANGGQSKTLQKLSLTQLFERYADPTVSGEPAHYIPNGFTISLYPTPGAGTLVVGGEFWPDTLADTAGSTNVLTDEVPEFLINLCAAEHFEFLQEEARGNLYRGKMATSLAEWIKDNRFQEMKGINNMPRDPLGNLGYNRRTRALASEPEFDTDTVFDPGVG